MKLKRDIVWFDFESTGTDTEVDRVVQIAATKIKVDGTKEVKETLINPEILIPKEASDVHGITDEMVKTAPLFKQIAVSLRAWLVDCDLGTFNGNQFDIPMLNSELVRAGLEPINWDFSTFDARILYQRLFPNTLSDIYKRLTGKELIDAHSAQADVDATIEVGDILLAKLREVEPEVKINSVKDLDILLQGDKKRVDISGKLYADKDGVVRYNFGKDRDLSVVDHPGFANWMINNNFPAETKAKIKKLLEDPNEINKNLPSTQE